MATYFGLLYQIHSYKRFRTNVFQVTGNTPLMYAAMENRTVLIERMIEMGCDIHAKNKEHYTTLHLASMYSREDTVKLLLSKKADPSVSGGVRIRISNHF